MRTPWLQGQTEAGVQLLPLDPCLLEAWEPGRWEQQLSKAGGGPCVHESARRCGQSFLSFRGALPSDTPELGLHPVPTGCDLPTSPR